MNGHARQSGALLIARDTAVFLILVLSAVVLYRLDPKLLTSSSGASSSSGTVVLQAEATVPPAASAAAASTANEQSAASSAVATEAPAASTPEPTAVPTATGDFSTVFPQTDTGAGALLSYQTDDVRIAVTTAQQYSATYYIADVWVRTIDSFHTAFAGGQYGLGIHDKPANVATQNGAALAVTGDYYGARDKGVVIRNGELYRDVMGDDMCLLRTDGTLSVFQKGSFSALTDMGSTAWQAWAFGPALVDNGAACDTSASSIRKKNPRCAIGYYEPGHYCFIVVDGRQTGYSEGMTLDELASVFVQLGCQTAYNLDGGATATMVFNGEVVNRPAGGGRESSDIIYFS